MVRHDASDGRIRWISAQQCAAHETHSAQRQITDRSHAQVLLASGAEGALCGSYGRANLGEIKRAVGICVQERLEPVNDRVVTAGARRGLDTDTFNKASYHHMNRLRFKCT